MAAISTWSTTAANNNSAVPDGAPENWKPSEVNNWGRETMAAVRTWYEDAEWIDFGHTIGFVSATQFTTASGDGDTTAIYHVGRRVRETGSLGGPFYGKVTASSHTTQTTVTVVWDAGALDASVSAMAAGINSADNPSIDISAVSGSFPSTTRMIFQQTAAPTGWTKDTTAAINDIALRLTTGTVTNSTGNDKFSTVFGTSKSTDTFQLLDTHLPVTTLRDPNQTQVNAAGADTSPFNAARALNTTFGGNTAHSHGISNLNLDYYEAIIASKD